MDGEWAYSYIVPKVFVEEFIDPDSPTPPPDFKFHCVSGKVRWLQFIFDRGDETKEVIVNADGSVASTHFDHNMLHRTEFKLPSNWYEMITVVERLASGWKYVRVDIYSCPDGSIYVGELTFFPLMGCYKGEGQKELGKHLDFDRTAYSTLVIPELERCRSRFRLYPAPGGPN